MLSELLGKFENDGIFRFSDNLPHFERIIVVDYKEIKKPEVRIDVFKNATYTFFLMEGGEANVVVNGYNKVLKPGDLVASIPGDVWNWKYFRELEGKFLFFEAPFILAGLTGGYSLEPIPHLNTETHYPFIQLTEKRFTRLKDLLSDMKECLDEKPVHYDLLRAELWQFIFLSEKEYVANGHAGRESITLNYIPTFVNLVNNNFKKHHMAAYYADKMNITPNYLNKIVKNAFGETAREYILKRIISEAKVLLRLTQVNINEVCYELGFEDPNYFIRLFKKAEGISPGEFQKRGTL